MNWLKRVNARIEALFTVPEPPPPPARPEFPCGVRDCFEEQQVVRQDERETVVECPVHDCVTTWETKKREEREQVLIRPDWRSYGTGQR